MAGACGTRTVGTGSYNLVSTQIQQAAARADAAVAKAVGLIDDIADFDVDNVNVNIDFPDDFLDFDQFVIPDTRPDTPDFNYQGSQVSGGNFEPGFQGSQVGPNGLLIPATSINPGAKPGDPPEAPTVALPGVPNLPTRVAPTAPTDDVPTLVHRTFPDAPVTVLPEVPTLQELNIPEIPVIDFSQLKTDFAALRALAPELDPTLVDELDFDVATTYAGQYNTLKQQLEACLNDNPINGRAQTTIGTMLDGGTGLPVAIQQQIHDQAVARADKNALQARQVAINTWASRGFSLPTGALQAQIAEITQNNQSIRVDTNRAVYIENARLEQQNRQFAVSAGLQNDSIYLQRFSTVMQGSQALTAIVADMARTIFNAKVRIYELRVQSWIAQLQAFEQLIRIELAQLEVVRAELENQRLVNELNNQNVAIYNAQLQGVLALVDVYRTQVQAVAEQVRADGIRIDAYRQRIEAYRANVDAFSAQTEADSLLIDRYRQQVEASKITNDIYESNVRAYGEEVRAYQANVDAARAVEDYKIQYNVQRLAQLNNELEEFRVQIQSEETRIRAQATAYTAEADMYRADVSAEQTRITADFDRYRLEMEEARIRASLETEKARLNITQVQRSESIVLQALIAAGQAASNLAASAMSGTSVNAGYSYRGSESDDSSCSVSGSI